MNGTNIVNSCQVGIPTLKIIYLAYFNGTFEIKDLCQRIRFILLTEMMGNDEKFRKPHFDDK